MKALRSLYNPFQSSPALSGRCNAERLEQRAYCTCVSILTGPFRPVQHCGRWWLTTNHDVSILTGPFRPVQLKGILSPAAYGPWFQSSPALSGRCNAPGGHQRRRYCRFNPHRPFQAGATTRRRGRPGLEAVFQSSPALSGRCNAYMLGALGLPYGVSILTGPFRPVQRAVQHGLHGGGPPVSILTGPFRPVQQDCGRSNSTAQGEFQSSPALSGRCNLVRASGLNARSGFQSSPALSGRCNGDAEGMLSSLTAVSILTGPFRPVQRVATLDGNGAVVSILTGPFRPVQQAK